MTQPNILFIMSDDHAAHAISAYGSKVNKTPHMDRLAQMGARFDSCFCTNSICAPSRAVILTGKYSHINGVTTLSTNIDNTQEMLPDILQRNGYQTGLFGKWHLGHNPENEPTGFDDWTIFWSQGEYFDPKMYIKGNNGEKTEFKGYATDIVTKLTTDWLDNRDKDKPFFALCWHKAPHRNWLPHPRHMSMFENEDIPYPETFDDDYEGRSDAVKYNEMGLEHLTDYDLKMPVPPNLSPKEEKKWRYQRYMKDYLRCIAGVDDSVGEIMDYLEKEGLKDNTIVVYTSDQGFFLGDHGWFDKRFMLEESLKMPFIMAYPDKIPPNTVIDSSIVSNVCFAPTFLDYCGIDIPKDMQGCSFKPILENNKPDDWVDALYYRYWEDRGEHLVSPHYGIRTHEYKLICYIGKAVRYNSDYLAEVGNSIWPQWELYDLKNDIKEIKNVYDDEAYAPVIASLKKQLYKLKEHYKDFED